MAWSKATKMAAAAKARATKLANARRASAPRQMMAEQPRAPAVSAVVPVSPYANEFRVAVRPGSQVTFRIGTVAVTVIGE